MTLHEQTAARAGIVADIRLLVAHGRGPETIRSEIGAWGERFQRGDDAALEMPALKSAVAGLVILAHANARFSCADEPRPSGRRPALEITDTGGYLLAQFIVIRLLAAAPLCEARRTELVHHRSEVVQRHYAQIERFLPAG